MKPYHFSLCVRGEPLASRAELGRSDQNGIGREKIGLNGSEGETILFDGRKCVFSGVFSSQISNEQQGDKDYGDRNENFHIDYLKQMHHDRRNCGEDAGDRIPVKSEEAFQIHRLRRARTVGMTSDHQKY